MIYLSKKEVNKCKSFIELMDLIIEKSDKKNNTSKKSKRRFKNGNSRKIKNEQKG